MKVNDFEINKVYELKELLKQEGKDFMNFDNQLKYSGAFVYFLKSGNVLLLPNSLLDSAKGIKFNDKYTFEKCLKEEKFPIENENPSNEESFQDEISQINVRIPQVLNYFKDSLNIVVDSDCNTMIKRVKAIKFQKNILKQEMYSAFLLGEQIRKSIRGRWILLKQYGTFNPFFIPAIINNSDQVILLSPISKLFFSDLEIELNDFLKIPFITQPKLALNTPYFKNLYPEYLILD
jgi:hypothetical protein